MPDDLSILFQEVQEEVTIILEEVLASFESPKPDQAVLRRSFEQAIREPGGVERWGAEHGEEEAVKQGVLLLKRKSG